ncbi:MAG: sugar nucleotide-binding protein, partial [Chitinophagaceae bacterium]|nr:sugar nucleotide-binding protein [Chitinophagaceae bacterium]
DKIATGVYHISGDDDLTPYQMAVAVAEHLHLNKNLINKVTAETFHQPAKRPPKTGFNISKAKKNLDFKATPFVEGLQRTFN